MSGSSSKPFDKPEQVAGEGWAMYPPAKMVPVYSGAKIPPGIAKKLHLIYKDSGYLKKDKRNDSQGFDYLSEEALVDRLRDLMITHGLIMIPSVEKIDLEWLVKYDYKTGKEKAPWPLTTVTVSYRIVDADTGEYTYATAVGSGTDMADKGLAKSLTTANKYFLMKLFQIPSGQDPDGESWGGPEVTEVTTAADIIKKTGTKKEKERDPQRERYLAAIQALMESVGDDKIAARHLKTALAQVGKKDYKRITDRSVQLNLHRILNGIIKGKEEESK